MHPVDLTEMFLWISAYFIYLHKSEMPLSGTPVRLEVFWMLNEKADKSF